jgi:hypothetical protein
MLSSIRKAVRNLSSIRLERTWTAQQKEVLQAIRWIHREHVSQLCRLGYSPREAFWLNLACLPFLPWSRGAAHEMPLNRVLAVYADLYDSTVEPLAMEDEAEFLGLLRDRYVHIREILAGSNGVPAGAPTTGAS